jgi:hypothetical protein
MRRLVLIVAVLLVACARPAPELDTDAGSTGQSGSVIFDHSIVSGTVDTGDSHVIYDHTIVNGVEVTSQDATSRLRGDAGARERRGRRAMADAGAPKMAKTAAPDDRVMACTRNATTGADLMDCLNALKNVAPYAPDAGRKLGATRPPIINPACAVPDWYWNPSTGLDAATCVTSGAPCKTKGEIMARTGTTCPLTTATTLHSLADDPSNADWLDWEPLITQGASSTILGTMTTTCSGTLASLAAKTRAAGTADGRLHADLGACAAGAQGLAIVNTSRSSSIAWVDSCSGTVCAITQPVASNVPTFNVTFPAAAEDDGWVNGNSFSLQRPSKVNLAAYKPVVVGDVLTNNFPASGYVGHIWIPNYGVSSVGSTYRFNLNVANVEIRVDANTEAIVGPVNDVEGNFANSWVSGSSFLPNTFNLAGSFAALSGGFNSWSGGLTEDAIVHGTLTVGQRLSDVSILGPVWVSGNVEIANDVFLSGDTGPGILYGTYGLISGLQTSSIASLTVDAPATTAFGGVATIGTFCNAGGFATAVDESVIPAQPYPHRALTPAALDAVIGGPSGTGFGGSARCSNGGTIFENNYAPSAPSSLCSSGQFMTGQSSVCATPAGTGCATCTTLTAGTGISVSGGPSYTVANTGATSVTGTSGVSCSPTTGAVSCSNTGVTSLAAGTGISVSASTGAVTVTNTVSLPVLTNHAIVTGQGTTTPLFLAPGSAGSLAISNGTDWLSVAAPLSPPFGGTGLTGPGASGNALTSNGSVWTSAPPPGTSVFAARAASTVTTSPVVDLNSATITVGASQKLNIWIWFDFGPNTDGPGLDDDMTYGDGINSGSLFTVNRTITIQANSGGSVATGRSSATLVDQTSTTGSVTVHALAQVPAGGAVSNPVGAAILLTLSN